MSHQVSEKLIITEPVFFNAIETRKKQILNDLPISQKEKVYRKRISKKELVILILFYDNLFFSFYHEKKLIGKVIFNGPDNVSYYPAQANNTAFYPVAISQSAFYDLMRKFRPNIFNWLLWNKL